MTESKELAAEETKLPIIGKNGFLEMVKELASMKIDVESMKAILEMNKDVMAKNAEMEFTQAMARLQAKLPSISKKGAIEFKDKNGTDRKTPFARYEDIDEAIRPFLLEEGFTLSFDTQWTDQGAIILGTLSHVGGHSKTSQMRLPLDSSGSKNNLQAMGSTIAYGRRYLVCMLLNIITKGQDNDADDFDKKEPEITEKEALSLIEYAGAGFINQEALLKRHKRKSIYDLKRTEYEEALRVAKDREAKKNV